jgi:hypothetical protein
VGSITSGNQECRPDRKTTVEECSVLTTRELRRWVQYKMAGSIDLTSRNGNAFRISYEIGRTDDRRYLRLDYPGTDNDEVSIALWLTTTPTQFGSPRWWFICPLIVDGNVCNRRVGKLYLPPGAKYFGCRTCYDLTYESCQQAHADDRWILRTEKLLLQERIAWADEHDPNWRSSSINGMPPLVPKEEIDRRVREFNEMFGGG